MFDVIKEDWKLINDKSQVSILKEITKQGNKLGEIYRNRYCNPCFDQFYILNMLLHIIAFINFYTNDVAFRYYFQLVCCHVCQDLTTCYNYNEKIMKKNCSSYSSQKSYFCQILLTMIGMTVTAVKVRTISQFQKKINESNIQHRPEEPLKITLYLVAQQFHLLIITLLVQVITDHSSELSNYMYVNKYISLNMVNFKMPIKIKKILHTMQMRSSKSYKLTAGGI
ncbi:unnamed protein product [Heterotrigona itama]|uniref:Uncharacterized protein n=1 Tax=Heterotrigona itama TaxID=395501 RepID=A0A6V7H0J4_9HYME|nr:unnamed protein product [Heterotrigona itama]